MQKITYFVSYDTFVAVIKLQSGTYPVEFIIFCKQDRQNTFMQETTHTYKVQPHIMW